MESKIIHGDCFEELRKLPNNNIDLILIDPPYEIDYGNNKWDKKGLDWNKLTEHFFRVLKEKGNLVVFQGWTNVSEIKEIISNKFILQNWIIWDRLKGRGAKTNFISTREDILWFSKSDKYIFNIISSNNFKKTKGMGRKNANLMRGLSNVWTDISPIVPWSNERNNHPTQKPIDLIKRIVNIFSDKEDLVLDCFFGSGTTGIACLQLNRKFIGIEKDGEYIKIAQKRIKPYLEQCILPQLSAPEKVQSEPEEDNHGN